MQLRLTSLMFTPVLPNATFFMRSFPSNIGYLTGFANSLAKTT